MFQNIIFKYHISSQCCILEIQIDSKFCSRKRKRRENIEGKRDKNTYAFVSRNECTYAYTDNYKLWGFLPSISTYDTSVDECWNKTQDYMDI